jgi:RNA polymerase sigma factor (sigma-70 family)
VVGLRGYAIPRDHRADIVQEVMIELWERLDATGFAASRTFDAFVRSLAYWRCIDWMRRRRTEVPLDRSSPAGSVSPQERLLEEERRNLGRRVLGRLAPSCRELIRLHAGQGLTYRQIAGRLNRSEGALRVQMTECLKKAREILGDIRRQEIAPISDEAK